MSLCHLVVAAGGAVAGRHPSRPYSRKYELCNPNHKELPVPLLFSLAHFWGAFLLFLVEPMIGKLLLPYWGGSAAVWNTCVLFFQAVLLLAYLYAHAVCRWGSPWGQRCLQGIVLIVPLASVPFSAGGVPAAVPAPPALALLLTLARLAALPVFAVATTGPLLQHWFARSRHVRGADPYFLFSASNLGSLAALAAFPVLVEPFFSLPFQEELWAIGYALFIVLFAACGAVSWPRGRHTAAAGAATILPPADPVPAFRLPWPRRLRWLALAAAPVSVMLGVTTYLTTDLAAFPLLWIIPLALYLITFILAFSWPEGTGSVWAVRAFPWVLLPTSVSLVGTLVWALVPLHLGLLFLAGFFCHAELARDRPAAPHLTEYYFWIALGGFMGGAFNAQVAPLLFHSVAEYSLALVAVSLLAPGATARRSLDKRLGPLLMAAVLLLLVVLLRSARLAAAEALVLANLLLASAPAMILLGLGRWPLRYGLLAGGAFVLLAPIKPDSRVLVSARSFFGVHRVLVDPANQFHRLVHGQTTHGWQSTDPVRACEPLGYFHRTSPIGEVFTALGDRNHQPIAVVGLGTGSLVAYRRPNQDFVFFEIDPVVVAFAENPRYFSFLTRCGAGHYSIVLGDGRLQLAHAPDGRFGLIVLDAFSADAIPIHLLTREAIGLYLRKLASRGVLAFQITNRYVDLAPVLGAIARDLDLTARVCADLDLTPAERAAGKAPSRIAILARRPEDLGPLKTSPRWRPIEVSAKTKAWTDDYSNLLQVLHL